MQNFVTIPTVMVDFRLEQWLLHKKWITKATPKCYFAKKSAMKIIFCKSKLQILKGHEKCFLAI
jgi:hypothetical protein